jgi:hypothetical protein
VAKLGFVQFVLPAQTPASQIEQRRAQLVSDIQSHGLNDKKMIETTTFEEFGLLGGEVGHAHDYP